MTIDLRSPEARARDAWLSSKEASWYLDADALAGDGDRRKSLRNRIEMAFLAGLAAGRKLEREEREGQP